MRGVVVELSAQRFGIPYECTCCGATPPNAEVPVPPRAAGPTLLFPYCKRCIEHARMYEAARTSSTLAMVIFVVASVVCAVKIGLLAGAVVFVVGVAASWWLRTWRQKVAALKRGASCASTQLAVEYRGWNGATHALAFESPTFAAKFAEENKPLLASPSPQLQRLVDGFHKARLAVPTPAIAAGVAPPPLTHRDWLVRLEGTEGTLSRRVQLQRALDMTEEAHPRRELIQAVAKTELAPLLARLQRLTSPAQKKAVIQQSIARIREDNIPEELQAAELQELQSRLAEL